MNEIDSDKIDLIADIKQKRPFIGIDYLEFNNKDGIHETKLKNNKGCIFSKTYFKCKIDISIIKEGAVYHLRSRAFKKDEHGNDVIAYNEPEETSIEYNNSVRYSFLARAKPKVENFVLAWLAPLKK